MTDYGKDFHSLTARPEYRTRQLADDALHRGDRTAAGYHLAIWAFARQYTHPVEAFEGCKEAVVLLDKEPFAGSPVTAKQMSLAASQAWQVIAKSLGSTSQSGDDRKKGCLAASVAWQRSAELTLKYGELWASMMAAEQLMQAATSLVSAENWEGTIEVCRTSLKLLANVASEFAMFPPTTPTGALPVYHFKDPSTLQQIYRELLEQLARYGGEKSQEGLTYFSSDCGSLCYFAASAYLRTGRCDLAKRFADAALWWLSDAALRVEEVKELDDVKKQVLGAGLVITAANQDLQEAGKSTTRTPTPNLDVTRMPSGSAR